jgi:hypothetical protein
MAQNLDDILRATGKPADAPDSSTAPNTPVSSDAMPSLSSQSTTLTNPEHIGTLDSVLQQTGKAEAVPEDVQKKQGMIEQLKQEVAGPGTLLGDSIASASDVGHGVRRMLEGDVVGGAKQAIGNIHGKTLASSTLSRGSEQIDGQKHPILKAGLEFAEGMTSPVNLSLVAASGGLGMIDSASKIYMAHQLANLGLTSQQIVDMYNRFPEVKKAWDKGDASKVLYEGTHLLLSGALAVAGMYDMAGKPLEVASPTDRSVAGKVAEVAGKGAKAVVEAPGKAVQAVKGKLSAPEAKVESNPIEDLKSAFPPSKTNPYDAEKAPQVAYNALAAEHKLNTIHDPVEAAEALQSQITKAEDKVMEGAIKQVPDEPILKNNKPVSVWDEVKRELDSRNYAESGFVDKAMDELEKFGLTKGKSVTVSDADRIRRQLNDQTTAIEKKPDYQQVRIENVDPKYAALQVAKDVLRDGVYDTIDAHGLDKGVTARDFRRDIIGNLISFKNAMLDKAFGADQQVKGTAPEAPEEPLARRVARGVAPVAGALAGSKSGALATAAGAYLGGEMGEKLLPPPEVPEDLTRSELLDRALNHPEADKFVTETPEEQQIRGRIQKPAELVAKGQEEIPYGPIPLFGRLQGKPTPLEMYPEDLNKISNYINSLREALENPTATSVEKDAAQHQLEQIFGGRIPEGFKRPKGQGAAEPAPKLLQAQSRFEVPTEIKSRTGLDTKAILNHELAHAALAHMAGFEVHDIISNKHMAASPQTIAALRVSLPEDLVKRSDGTLEPKGLKEHLPDVLSMYMAGAAANELYDGVKIEDNKALGADLKEVKDALDLLGLSAEEKDRFIEWGITRAKATLSDPDVENLVNEFSDTRERGLPESHHYSTIRLMEFKDRLDQLRGKNAINPEGTHGSGAEYNPTGEPNRETNVAASDTGEAAGTTADEVRTPEEDFKRELFESLRLPYKPPPTGTGPGGTLLQTTERSLPPEHTTGQHDAPIKEAGAIPGGIWKGDKELNIPDMALFHDPTSGSTLALPVDKVTKEAVIEQLEKNREQYRQAAARKVNLSTQEPETTVAKPPKKVAVPKMFTPTEQDEKEFEKWPVTGPKDATGMVTPGNIDLTKRPLVHHKDGSVSTLYSLSFSTDKGEVLVPAVSPDGKMLTTKQAMKLFADTGEHLGIFKTPADADTYAEMLHNRQGAFQTYKNHGQYSPSVETWDEIKH